MTGMREYHVAAVLAAWLIVVFFFMILSHTPDLEVFFVLSPVTLLMVTALVDGASSRPCHMHYPGYLIVAGVTLFACIVVEKILETLAA